MMFAARGIDLRSVRVMQLALSGFPMLIELMRVVAREAGFIIINHSLGFTAYRLNDDRNFLFCLSTGEWAIYATRTTDEVAHGRGATSFLTVACQYFDLPPDASDAAEREIAA
jgi:hypothetical protein